MLYKFKNHSAIPLALISFPYLKSEKIFVKYCPLLSYCTFSKFKEMFFFLNFASNPAFKNTTIIKTPIKSGFRFPSIPAIPNNVIIFPTMENPDSKTCPNPLPFPYRYLYALLLVSKYSGFSIFS